MPLLASEAMIAVVFLTASCGLFYQTLHFPKTRISTIGPEYWPQILLAGLIMLSVYLLADIYRRREALAGEKGAGAPYPLRFWYTLGLAVIYTIIMPILGFPISTLLFAITIMRVLGLRETKLLLTTAAGAAALFIILFPKLMAVPMPRGAGICRTISLLFY